MTIDLALILYCIVVHIFCFKYIDIFYPVYVIRTFYKLLLLIDFQIFSECEPETSEDDEMYSSNSDDDDTQHPLPVDTGHNAEQLDTL